MTVHLAGPLARIAGRRAWQDDVFAGMTVETMFARLCRQFPRLRQYEGHLLFTLNSEYAGLHDPVCAGDVICLLPAGGGAAL